MSGVLVDSNVLLDLFKDDPQWGEWSLTALERAAAESTLFFNPVVYAEISIGFERIETLEETLSQLPLRMAEIPRAALFLAGKAFLDYRRNTGGRRSPLPDFFIGAHAAVYGFKLLTRDAGRYRSYFPTVELIAPA